MASDSQVAGKGRPTEYTAEIGMTICGRLVEGESLRKICADAGIPDVAMVNRAGLTGVSVGELCSHIAEPPGLSFV